MAESRDDFIIAIRSAFLKKSTKQKFSLLTLVFFSIFIIVLSSFNFKAINVTKSVIKEIGTAIPSNNNTYAVKGRDLRSGTPKEVNITDCLLYTSPSPRDV